MPIEILGQGPVPGLPFDPKKVKKYGKGSEWDRFLEKYPMGMDTFKFGLTAEDEELYEYYRAYSIAKSWAQLKCEKEGRAYSIVIASNMFKAQTKAFRSLAAFIYQHRVPAIAYLRAQLAYGGPKLYVTMMYSEKALQRWEQFARVEMGKHILDHAKAKAMLQLNTVSLKEEAWHLNYLQGESRFQYYRNLYPRSVTDLEVICIEAIALPPEWLVTRQDFMAVYVFGSHPRIDAGINAVLKYTPPNRTVYQPCVRQ